MVFQVFGHLRCAMRRQISGARTDGEPDRRQPPGDERRIFEHADPHGKVKAIIHQVDEAITHGDVDRNFRVIFEEVWQRGRQVQETEAHRRADAQKSARRGLQLADGKVGFLQICKDFDAPSRTAAPEKDWASATRTKASTAARRSILFPETRQSCS